MSDGDIAKQILTAVETLATNNYCVCVYNLDIYSSI